MAVLSSFDPFATDAAGEEWDGSDDADAGVIIGSARGLSAVPDAGHDDGSDAAGFTTEGAGVGSGSSAGSARPDLAELIERIRPTALAAERTLAVPDALGELFPLGGIARGSRLSLRGSGATSLCLATLAEASREGSWIAVVGLGSLGWAAAVRAGWRLERTVLIDAPPTSRWGTVMATLLDAIDVVVVDPTHQVGATDARRLVARSRERGSVLVDLAAPDGRGRYRWPLESDLTITASTLGWDGLELGAGLLGERRLAVQTAGRRGAARQRQLEVAVGVDGVMRRVHPSSPSSPHRHLRAVG